MKKAKPFETCFEYFPTLGVLAWSVFKSGEPDVMQYVWPIIYMLIHSPQEAYDLLKCVCTLNMVYDGTNDPKPSMPNEKVHKFKLFCSLVDVGKDIKRSVEKACADIVANLNVIGNRPHDKVCLTLICSFQYMILNLTPSIFDCQTTKTYRHIPKFVFSGLKILEKAVPISFLAYDNDIPRLIFKMFAADKTKDELANDRKLMKLFFGSVAWGKTILDEMSDDEWRQLNYSASTQDKDEE